MQPDVVDREIVDFAAVANWMDEQGLGEGPLDDAHLLAGGTQNVMVGFRRGGQRFVLRRPPPHLRPTSNANLRREIRVLSTLGPSDVPHPGLIAACDDESVIGAVFHLSEFIDGFNPSTGLPALHASDPAIQHEMGLQMPDAIAALGAVDYVAAGLTDVGHPEGFLERQVRRWFAELEGYSKLEGYPGPEIPGLDPVAAWLDDHRPAAWTPGLIHGDFHLSNVMFAHDSARMAAVVDWEMTTVGDPLLDLGWLLATWPDPANPAPIGAGIFTTGALPTQAELIERYRARTTRDLSAIGWYTVMACFKLGIVLEGTHARAFAGKAPKATGDMLHATTLGLFRRAEALIAAS